MISSIPISYFATKGSRSETRNNPGVQRTDVNIGEVETIVFGMSRREGIRTTPWGTILETEKTDDGTSSNNISCR